jgi:hypothetical protein
MVMDNFMELIEAMQINNAFYYGDYAVLSNIKNIYIETALTKQIFI